MDSSQKHPFIHFKSERRGMIFAYLIAFLQLPLTLTLVEQWTIKFFQSLENINITYDLGSEYKVLEHFKQQMRSKPSYIPQQYTCPFYSHSPATRFSPSTALRKKSTTKSIKKSPVNKFLVFDSTAQQSLQSSRERFTPRKQNSRVRSITQNSNLKEKRSREKIETEKQREKSKSRIKSKVVKSPTNAERLVKQNLKLKKALKESEQQKIMLSQKLQFIKTNMKSPPKSEYLPKLNELTNLVKSLKKTYQQDQISRLPTQSAYKSKIRRQSPKSQQNKRQQSRNKLESIIRTIQHGLKEIQGHKEVFQNFTNHK